MTQGEAKVLETDVVILPIEFDQEKEGTVLAEESATNLVVEKQSIRTDLKIRFARLKKSLPKRAASIF